MSVASSKRDKAGNTKDVTVIDSDYEPSDMEAPLKKKRQLRSEDVLEDAGSGDDETPAEELSAEELPAEEAPAEKRGRGRPKKSQNEPNAAAPAKEAPAKQRGPGRPKGSLNKPKPKPATIEDLDKLQDFLARDFAIVGYRLAEIEGASKNERQEIKDGLAELEKVMVSQTVQVKRFIGDTFKKGFPAK